MIRTETLVEIINEIIKLTKDKKIIWEKHQNEYVKSSKLDIYSCYLLDRYLSISKSNMTFEDITKSNIIYDDSINLVIDGERISNRSNIFSYYTANPVNQLYNLITTGNIGGLEAISFEKFLSDIKTINGEVE